MRLSIHRASYMSAIALLCLLASCSDHPTPAQLIAGTAPIKHKKTAKPAAPMPAPAPVLFNDTPESVVTQLSLARLQLAAAAPDPAVMAARVKILADYNSLKNSKPIPVTLLILDYKSKNDAGMHQVIAPILPGQDDFEDVLKVFNMLGQSTYTLYNVTLTHSMLSSDNNAIFISTDNIQLKNTLESEEQRLMNNNVKLPIIEDARLQLKLIPFFTQHHLRDPAYLTVENAKQLLAAAARQPGMDASTTQSLSEQLEAEETELRTRLPFTLSGPI